jgi:hypothetical protein
VCLKDIRAITVCVDYSDLLDMSLARNKQHFKSLTVVTHPRDEKTIKVAVRHEADVFQTEVFYDRGADFNKFAAMEKGLDHLGRTGWLAILDADILLPPLIPDWQPSEGCLYVPHRRMFPTVPICSDQIPDFNLWGKYRYPMANEEFAGYCQIFHADDPMLGPAPWHETDCTWAGGPDSGFHQKWPVQRKVRPPFEVLHLGPSFQNWAGRVTKYADGSVPPEADQRAHRRALILEGRRRLGREGKDMFSGEKLP